MVRLKGGRHDSSVVVSGFSRTVTSVEVSGFLSAVASGAEAVSRTFAAEMLSEAESRAPAHPIAMIHWRRFSAGR